MRHVVVECVLARHLDDPSARFNLAGGASRARSLDLLGSSAPPAALCVGRPREPPHLQPTPRRLLNVWRPVGHRHAADPQVPAATTDREGRFPATFLPTSGSERAGPGRPPRGCVPVVYRWVHLPRPVKTAEHLSCKQYLPGERGHHLAIHELTCRAEAAGGRQAVHSIQENKAFSAFQVCVASLPCTACRGYCSGSVPGSESHSAAPPDHEESGALADGTRWQERPFCFCLCSPLTGCRGARHRCGCACRPISVESKLRFASVCSPIVNSWKCSVTWFFVFEALDEVGLAIDVQAVQFHPLIAAADEDRPVAELQAESSEQARRNPLPRQFGLRLVGPADGPPLPVRKEVAPGQAEQGVSRVPLRQGERAGVLARRGHRLQHFRPPFRHPRSA